VSELTRWRRKENESRGCSTSVDREKERQFKEALGGGGGGRGGGGTVEEEQNQRRMRRRRRDAWRGGGEGGVTRGRGKGGSN